MQIKDIKDLKSILKDFQTNIQEKDLQINIKEENTIIFTIIKIMLQIDKVDTKIIILAKGEDLMSKKEDLNKEIIIQEINKNIKLINGQTGIIDISIIIMKDLTIIEGDTITNETIIEKITKIIEGITKTIEGITKIIEEIIVQTIIKINNLIKEIINIAINNMFDKLYI
jgi:hypothetical protein